MAEFSYTTVPGKIKTLLGKIREVGVPPKVTVQWLKTVGFTSSNDSSLVGVLKQVQFIDSGGVPTEKWSQYRGADHKNVLGRAIRDGYAELYAVYPDAERRSQQDLDHFFSTRSAGGKEVIAKTISTFKSLAELSEIPASSEQVEPPSTTPPPTPPFIPSADQIQQQLRVPSIHVDIQVHLSPEATAEQIDKVFESMARHLYPLRAPGK